MAKGELMKDRDSQKRALTPTTEDFMAKDLAENGEFKPRAYMRRLEGKVTVLTGGGGSLGYAIAEKYLEEGAQIVLTGRTLEHLQQAMHKLLADNPASSGRVHIAVLDGACPDSLRMGAEQIYRQVGPIDILINNAGSVGPRQQLANIPLSESDLNELMAVYGVSENETLGQAVGSLLGSAWYTTLAFLPYLNRGASVINISTIFSKSEYYGRTAYVVPKAGLNALTQMLACELGHDCRGLRINTVLPGPVESERIYKVFAAMDKLKNAPEGTTSEEVVSHMLLQYPSTGSFYLSKKEITDTILFLGSDESTGYSGHEFQVTHGLQVPAWHSEVIAQPDLKNVNIQGELIWIVAGEDAQEACELCEKYQALGAQLLVTFRHAQALQNNRHRFAHFCGLKSPYENFQSLGVADPFQAEHWSHWQREFARIQHFPRAILVLCSGVSDKYGSSILSQENVEAFLNGEFCEVIAISRQLDRLMQALDSVLPFDPSIIYLSDPGSVVKGEACAFPRILSAGIQQLIRVWRNEVAWMEKSAGRTTSLNIYQIIRFENHSAYNLEFSAEWALFLACVSNHFAAPLKEIDVILSPSLQTFSSDPHISPVMEYHRLHEDCVALITGGSEGIGAEIGRQLALAGAKVVLASRSLEKLTKKKESIIRELTESGFSQAESRVAIFPNCDVKDLAVLEGLIEKVILQFGRIDYIVNNAGIVGAEEMIVDLSLESWNETLIANLISNYALIIHALPTLKQMEFGHILNISSHFGGTRGVSVPYPNRADYAVSKTGQRSLVEVLAQFIGPDIQINAIAPGPVEGARLRGSTDKPGLFMRRGKLILQNKLLNVLYTEVVKEQQAGHDLSALLELLAQNDHTQIMASQSISKSFKAALEALSKRIPQGANPTTEPIPILNLDLFGKLLKRLKCAKILSNRPQNGYLQRNDFDEDLLLKTFVVRDAPIYSEEDVQRYAQTIEADILKISALQKLPTEEEVGRDIILFLANHTISGETYYPSCGLNLARLPRETSKKALPNLSIDEPSADRIVLILGNTMFEHMAQLAAKCLKRFPAAQSHAQPNPPADAQRQKVVIVCGSKDGGEQLQRALSAFDLPEDGQGVVIKIAELNSSTLNHTIDGILDQCGNPQLIVSFPWGKIPTFPLLEGCEWESLPSTQAFQEIISQQITSHFSVIKRASLIDRSKTVVVTAEVAEKANSLHRAFAEFVRTSLQTLVMTANIEGSRIVHQPSFHQIDPGTSAGKLCDMILTQVDYDYASHPPEGGHLQAQGVRCREGGK